MGQVFTNSSALQNRTPTASHRPAKATYRARRADGPTFRFPRLRRRPTVPPVPSPPVPCLTRHSSHTEPIGRRESRQTVQCRPAVLSNYHPRRHPPGQELGVGAPPPTSRLSAAPAGYRLHLVRRPQLDPVCTSAAHQPKHPPTHRQPATVWPAGRRVGGRSLSARRAKDGPHRQPATIYGDDGGPDPVERWRHRRHRTSSHRHRARTGVLPDLSGGRRAAGSGSWTVGSEQWTVGSEQWAVGGGQWAAGSERWAAGGGQ